VRSLDDVAGSCIHTKERVQFVKTFCEVLSLDPLIAEEVAQLRRTANRLISARDFSADVRVLFDTRVRRNEGS
jgi:hypothetical protein